MMVSAQLLAQVRPLHFHHHTPSIPELGGVDLSQAGAAQGLLLERGEELADPGAKLGFYCRGGRKHARISWLK